MRSINSDALRFRPSVIVGELAANWPKEFLDSDVKMCSEGFPAPFGAEPLHTLNKQEAKERLAAVAEIALAMAETIDTWWDKE